MATHELKHLISDAPRVMVVDGSKLVRKLISDVLQRDLPGVEVVGCASIEEARAALAAGPVHLVTTCWRCPMATAWRWRAACAKPPARPTCR